MPRAPLRIIVCLLLWVMPATTMADRDRNWVFLADDSSGTPLFYALEGSGEKFMSGGLLGLVFDKPRIWSRALFPNQPWDYKGQPVNEMIHHYEFDCSGQESRRLEATFYFNGKEVKSFAKGRWKGFDRPSRMSLLMNVACN